MVHEAGHDAGGSADSQSARPAAALVATVVVLAVWNLGVRPALAPHHHLPARLVVGALVLAIGLWAGLGTSGLGLAPERFRSGLRWGGAAAGVVLAVVAAGALLPATHGSYDVARAHVGLGELLQQVLVVIPLSTVVVEEVAFRGTLLGLLLVLVPRGWALAVSAAVFGLWHLAAVIASTHGSTGHVALVGLGTVAATGAAGVVFGWLRLRSGSLLAPALAHLATNTMALVLAWAVVH
jgi:membrane protease YdiL (CAAX protease family)